MCQVPCQAKCQAFCCYWSVVQSCPTLCDLMDCSMPGFLHYLPDFAQTHFHWVSDAIQPYHPLYSPSPPALNLSQHQGLFWWVGSSYPVAFRIRWPKDGSFSFSISPSNQDWFPLGLTCLISLLSKGLSRVFSSTTVQNHQFFSAQPGIGP